MHATLLKRTHCRVYWFTSFFTLAARLQCLFTFERAPKTPMTVITIKQQHCFPHGFKYVLAWQWSADQTVFKRDLKQKVAAKDNRESWRSDLDVGETTQEFGELGAGETTRSRDDRPSCALKGLDRQTRNGLPFLEANHALHTRLAAGVSRVNRAHAPRGSFVAEPWHTDGLGRGC